MEWLDDTREFFRDMFRHWVGIVSGIFSILTALFQLNSPSYFSGDKGLTHSRVLFALLSIAAFFLACRSAWNEKRVALHKSAEELDSAIDTNRPEVTAEFTMGPTNHTFMGGGPQVKVINRGSSDAWSLQIEDAVIGNHIVSFNCPPILEKNKPFEANCSIKGMNINFSNGLERLLHAQAQEQIGKEVAHGEGVEVHPDSYKVSFDLNVRWEDSRGNMFTSLGRVTYLYANRIARTEFPSGIRRLPKESLHKFCIACLID
ncbi:hypothetical protein [Tunturiibacter gelidiferens]|uniref:hypothetical protein n=1 Tax=Tunturiibacter gelidiferens TaxID=3069689 RepID=UPI003D9AC1EC